MSSICGKGIERGEKRMKWKRKKKSEVERRNRMEMERREIEKDLKRKIKEGKLYDSRAKKEIIGIESKMEETREERRNSDSCLIPINLICENEYHKRDKKMK